MSSLLDQVIQKSIDDKVISPEIPVKVEPLKQPKPLNLNELVDKQELDSNLVPKPTELKLTVDKNKESLHTEEDTSTRMLSEEIKDNRISQDTGRLVHNWMLSYFKSLKKLIADTVDDSIVNYEFNFVSKSVAVEKLYNNSVHKNPSCIINLDAMIPDTNLDPVRKNSGLINEVMTQPIAINHTTDSIVKVDFKFVNLQQNIVLNFDEATDVFNYYDRLTSVFPLNQDFFSYKYKTLINIQWEPTDETEGVVWDGALAGNDHYAGVNGLTKNNPQAWAIYYCEPLFTIDSMNTMIDKTSAKYSINISLKTLLQIPQTIYINKNNELKVTAIQIVLDIGDNSSIIKNQTDTNVDDLTEKPKLSLTDKPICIDIERDVYDSYKMENVFQLTPGMNVSSKYKSIYLPKSMLSTIENKAAAIYINSDSTINDSKLIWSELGYLSTDDISGVGEYKDLYNTYTIKYMGIEDFIDSGIDLEKYGIQLTPEDKLEIIQIPILDYDRIQTIFSQDGPWFDMKLLIFNV